jgi:hypothetical protein
MAAEQTELLFPRNNQILATMSGYVEPSLLRHRLKTARPPANSDDPFFVPDGVLVAGKSKTPDVFGIGDEGTSGTTVSRRV